MNKGGDASTEDLNGISRSCLARKVEATKKIVYLVIMLYWQLAKVSFQEVMAYPARVFGILGVRVMTWLSFLVLWNVVYREREFVGSYTLADMVTYYSLALIITELTRVWTLTKQFADFVHRGDLSNWLLKPIRVSLSLFVWFITERVCYTLLPILVFGGAILYNPALFQVPEDGLLFLVSLILAIFLSHLMCSIIGLLAFWLTQTNGIRNVFARLTEVLGGMIFPLELLPMEIRKYLLDLLPFQFTQFVPISIYMGKADESTIYRWLGTQVMWIGLFAVLYWWTWQKGVRRYEAVGR